MSVTAPDDAFLDVNDAHLRVFGNVHADGLKLGQLEVVTTTSTGSTIQFLHQHTAFTTTSNIEVGTTNHDLFVDTNTSRVGILTNTPTTALDVNGTVKATAFDGDGALLTGIPSSAINGTLSQWTTVTGPKIHYSDGNVGIGIADPLHTLDVVGDINFTGTLREDGNPFVSTPWTIETSPAALSYTGGNVGIGAATPSSKLEVTGNAHVTTDLSVGGTLSINTITAAATHALSAVTAVGASTGDTIQLTNATTGLVTTANVDVGKDLTVTGNVAVDTDTLFVDSVNDRVGIGTTAPGSALDVVGDATISSNLVVGTNKLFVDTVGGAVGIGSTLIDITDNTLSGAGNGLYIHNPVEGGHLLTLGTQRPWVFEQGLADASTKLCLRSLNSGKKFSIQSPDHSNVMTIVATDGGGAVGIGTSNPGAPLDVFAPVASGTQRTALRLTTPESAAGTGCNLDFYQDTANVGRLASVYEASGKLGMTFSTWNGGLGERMRIKHNGNVGIGTSSPQDKLHTDIIRIGDWNGGGNGYKFFMDTNAYLRLQYMTGQTVYKDIMTLRYDNGNVGIGTSSPDSSLEVHGTGIHINGTVLRAMSAIGTVASGTYIKLCDFSALPTTTNGVCAISIRWGVGTGSGVYYYWQGHATGIVGYNTYGDGNGTFNGSGVEPLTLNHHYHYRAVGALSFRIDSDASGTSYGRHSIYMAPNASIDSMSFEVIAMPLRR